MNCCVSGALVSSAAVNQSHGNERAMLLLKRLAVFVGGLDLTAKDAAVIGSILDQLMDHLTDD